MRDIKIGIEVYDLDFNPLGFINNFKSLSWGDLFFGYGSIDLWAPINEENAKLLVKDNILWLGGKSAAIIEVVKSGVDNNGDKIYNIKGRTLEMLATTRIIWETYIRSAGYPSDYMNEIVDANCIHPVNADRVIPYLEIESLGVYGAQSSYQKTGGEVYDALLDLGISNNLGFEIEFDPRNLKLIFRVLSGVDRTIGQAVVDPVVLSTDLEDILESSYYSNKSELKTTALVAGAGEGITRKLSTSGELSVTGFNRREMYIDARDLVDTMRVDDVEVVIGTTEYNEMLNVRGQQYLADAKLVENFEATIRVIGETQYVFGVDYDKGDLITIQDNQLGVQVSAKITEVEEVFDEEYSLVLTFGFSYPTIIQKVNRVAKQQNNSGATAIPTSLPANGGNADTVDGKHASEFADNQGLSKYSKSQADLPNDYPMGFTWTFVRANEGWFNYGMVMTCRGYYGGGGTYQSYTPYGSGHGGTAQKIRFGNFNVNSGNSWTEWKTVAYV